MAQHRASQIAAKGSGERLVPDRRPVSHFPFMDTIGTIRTSLAEPADYWREGVYVRSR